MNGKLTWQHVALVGVLLLVLGGLAFLGKDGSQVLAGVLAVMAALGFGHLISKQNETQATVAKLETSSAEIRENTNGRLTAMQELVEKALAANQNAAEQHRRDMRDMADKLAMMMPPPADPPVSGPGGEGDSPNV